jgi:hypothetical protein
MAIDLSALFGQQPDYSSFISPAEQQRMQQNASQQSLLNAAIALLARSGTQRSPISTQEALAGALAAGSEGYNQAFDRTLKQMVTGMQLEEFKRKQRAREIASQAFRKEPVPIDMATGQGSQLAMLADPMFGGDMPGVRGQERAITETAATLRGNLPTRTIVDRELLAQAAAAGDDFTTAAKILEPTERKESFRPMTADEKKQAGLPADRPYQISTTGKIQDIGTGPQSVVNVLPAQGERERGYGKFGVEKNTQIFEAGQTAVKNIGKINETLNLLEQGSATTGLGADILNNINRTQVLFTNSKKKINEVSDTELLNSLLGADVFPQIGALGIGAKGLDTPAEREFLRQVMTGTINMNKETLVRLTKLRKKYEERSLSDYNRAVDEGQLDELFKFSGLPKRKLVVPSTSITVNY